MKKDPTGLLPDADNFKGNRGIIFVIMSSDMDLIYVSEKFDAGTFTKNKNPAMMPDSGFII